MAFADNDVFERPIFRQAYEFQAVVKKSVPWRPKTGPLNPAEIARTRSVHHLGDRGRGAAHVDHGNRRVAPIADVNCPAVLGDRPRNTRIVGPR